MKAGTIPIRGISPTPRHTFPGANPMLSRVLADRKVCLVAAVSALVYFGLSMMNVAAWTCPVRGAMGVDCPGCGMTRGVTAWLHGHPAEAFAAHPLSIVVLAGLTLIILSAVLPKRIVGFLVSLVGGLERRLAVVPLFGVLLIFTWITRAVIQAAGSA